ncbi:hypothetical protein AMAG_16360 [Allomyces macrogynus ATCC 38327]|uniref:DH domain-containing protein n=1 Tax=Allomyces macrogynus (strain ATCC 38327) TaxID=578462 RepID=A0A0L0TB37_ALLM3|nr:hypothetical protein AMAG_16360 [Allomyces macrogynus ATCC 38327]|eukprot:KNE71936.1 hypothetical protein AMAG_16360 [Allomyces macrogynus ATCC 38327]
MLAAFAAPNAVDVDDTDSSLGTPLALDWGDLVVHAVPPRPPRPPSCTMFDSLPTSAPPRARWSFLTTHSDPSRVHDEPPTSPVVVDARPATAHRTVAVPFPPPPVRVVKNMAVPAPVPVAIPVWRAWVKKSPTKRAKKRAGGDSPMMPTPTTLDRDGHKLWDRIVRELVETEDLYVRELGVLEEAYLIPLRHRIPGFYPKDACPPPSPVALPPPLPDPLCRLLVASRDVTTVADLLARRLRWATEYPDDESIGQVFSALIPSVLAAYRPYCSAASAGLVAAHHVEKHDQHIQRLRAAVQNVHAIPNDPTASTATRRWDLSWLLIKPIQRVLKYPLFLRQLAKATAPSDDMHTAIEIALAAIDAAAADLNAACHAGGAGYIASASPLLSPPAIDPVPTTPEAMTVTITSRTTSASPVPPLTPESVPFSLALTAPESFTGADNVRAKVGPPPAARVDPSPHASPGKKRKRGGGGWTSWAPRLPWASSSARP